MLLLFLSAMSSSVCVFKNWFEPRTCVKKGARGGGGRMRSRSPLPSFQSNFVKLSSGVNQVQRIWRRRDDARKDDGGNSAATETNTTAATGSTTTTATAASQRQPWRRFIDGAKKKVLETDERRTSFRYARKHLITTSVSGTSRRQQFQTAWVSDWGKLYAAI